MPDGTAPADGGSALPAAGATLEAMLPLLLALACRPDAPADSAGGGPVDAGTACNGHDALCDRPLDRVTLPGTHNSMSNADAGWIAPNQQHGLTRQLEDGVRAMMLDTYEWDGGLWLCHGYCELGAQPLAEGLGELEAYLAAHPREVLVVIFQDGVPVEPSVAALEASGLADRVWTWDRAAPMPTLGALIDADQRLILSAESSGPPPGWYHHAWDLFTDTPYSFASADEFSCALNRGQPDNPFLLVNHWISDPLPTQEGAAEVNARGPLLARAEACAAERDRPVNVLAVDFYEQGDLFAVVDALNGLEE